MDKLNIPLCKFKIWVIFVLFILQGAFVYEGKMIDRPLLLQAKNIVNLQEIIHSLDS